MKILRTENDVKDILKSWYDKQGGWHYAPIQTGMGVHGVHDRVGGLPITITPEMVGKQFALLCSVEAKKPGRRGEKNRGMTKHQFDHMVDINKIGGLSICCDGYEDLKILDTALAQLRGTFELTSQ